MQSVPVTTNALSLNPAGCKQYPFHSLFVTYQVEAVVHTENISSVDRKRKLSDSNETKKFVVENREVAGDDIECITSVDEVVNGKERKNKENKKGPKR